LRLAKAECFAGGTLVHAESGLIAIEDIDAGDLVWSANPETGEVHLRRVIRTFVRHDRQLVAVELNNQPPLKVTPNHPFWTQRGWVSAWHLQVGDLVLQRDQNWLAVDGVEILEEKATVYNFEVEAYHTYFVGSSGSLVHNDCVDIARAIAAKLPEHTKCFGKCMNFAS